MNWMDTHIHVYLPEFDADRDEMITRALKAGVRPLLMPNVNQKTIAPMMKIAAAYPGICLPMMALHPTSVKNDFREQLFEVEQQLARGGFLAVGETGMDLYWDKTHLNQQIDAFRRHVELALLYDLPLVIHSRQALEEIFAVLEPFRGSEIKGVFHCFPGNIREARKAIELGFVLGIGGVVTYKNSSLAGVVQEIGPEHIILETDGPYLPPVPYRGKRNESAYIPLIGQKVAEITGTSPEKVAEITTRNAMNLFKIYNIVE